MLIKSIFGRLRPHRLLAAFAATNDIHNVIGGQNLSQPSIVDAASAIDVRQVEQRVQCLVRSHTKPHTRQNLLHLGSFERTCVSTKEAWGWASAKEYWCASEREVGEWEQN